MILFKAAYILCRICLKLWYRPRFIYVDKKVQDRNLITPCIIIANHNSLTNGPLLFAALNGNLSALIARDWYEKKGMRRIYDRLHCIPCDRYGLDTNWLRLAIKEIKEGRSVVIFPEGKTRKDGELNDYKPGFALLAVMTGVPVVTVSISSNYSFWRPPVITIDLPRFLDKRKSGDGNYLLEQSKNFRSRTEELGNLK